MFQRMYKHVAFHSDSPHLSAPADGVAPTSTSTHWLEVFWAERWARRLVTRALGRLRAREHGIISHACAVNWMNWWMWCDVATPPSFDNSMIPWWFGNRNSSFQLREVLWIAMSQRKRIGFEMLPLVWMKIASMLIVWLHWLLCVCVLVFLGDDAPDPSPFEEKDSHRLNIPVRTSRCDHHVLLDSGWVATDEKNMRFFVSKSYVYIYILCFIMYHPACLPAGSRRRGITAVLDQGGHNWPLRGHVERWKLTLLEILGAKKGYPQAIILWNMLFAYSVHTRFLSCGDLRIRGQRPETLSP